MRGREDAIDVSCLKIRVEARGPRRGEKRPGDREISGSLGCQRDASRGGGIRKEKREKNEGWGQRMKGKTT